jgi:hypothetical protein
MRDRNTEIASENARLGAMLGRKGLTPDQAAAVVAASQPVLAEAANRLQRGENITFAVVPTEED